MHSPVILTTASKPVSVFYTGTSVSLPPHIQAAIDRHWDARNSTGKSFTRGDVFTIQDVIETPDHIQYTVALTDYAHYLASIAGIEDVLPYRCRVVHTSVLIKTADNYLAFGEMAAHTSTPGRLQCAGGGITRADLKEGNILGIKENAETELFEETGLDCCLPQHGCTLNLAYIKSGGTYNFIGAMFVAQTLLTSDELRALFKAHTRDLLANGEKPELAQLILIKNDPHSVLNFLQEDQRPQEDYLAPWLKKESAMKES